MGRSVVLAAYGVFAGSAPQKGTRGEKLYMTYCASCHGTTGKGDGPVAAALRKAPSDLTMIPKENGKFPAVRVKRFISGDDAIEAHGTRDMPVWGNYFKVKHDNATATANVYSLMRYVESIQVAK